MITSDYILLSCQNNSRADIISLDRYVLYEAETIRQQRAVKSLQSGLQDACCLFYAITLLNYLTLLFEMIEVIIHGRFT